MLEDAWAIGDTDGFRYRDLDHGGWMQPAKQKQPQPATVAGALAL
jgi:hypothetical protein